MKDKNERRNKMKDKKLKILYYIAWAVGIIAAIALIYGIIRALI